MHVLYIYIKNSTILYFNTNLSEPIIATPIGFSSCMYASLSPGKITFSANCAEL